MEDHWTQNVHFNVLYSFCLKIYSILRIIQRDFITNIHRSSCEVTVVLVKDYSHLNFFNRF